MFMDFRTRKRKKKKKGKESGMRRKRKPYDYLGTKEEPRTKRTTHAMLDCEDRKRKSVVVEIFLVAQKMRERGRKQPERERKREKPKLLLFNARESSLHFTRFIFFSINSNELL